MSVSSITIVTMVGSQGEYVSTPRAPMNADVLQATSTAARSINACVSKGEYVDVYRYLDSMDIC